MILQDYDEEKIAILNPHELEKNIDNFPKIGVSCFSKKLIDKYVELYNPKQIAEISNANGRVPVYELNYKGTKVAFFMSRVGASACTVSYEEVSVMGMEKLIISDVLA
ncbi:MAG: purine-nucleoside phosphorylase [Bacilli bacterium]